MSYLKALGVLRLVSEQRDPGALAWWNDDVFYLRTALDDKQLVSFFVNEYVPTPIVVPWSGSDFFKVDGIAKPKTYKQTPTGPQIIAAILGTESNRLQTYRKAIRRALEALRNCGIDSKLAMKKSVKAQYLSHLRGVAPDELVDWIDAATVLSDEKATFSFLLGSGGGSDGNSHFSDNFMQNLWEVIPDFDERRRGTISVSQKSTALLRAALFGSRVRDLAYKRTSSLFDSGAVGGPNATQDFERDALANPWNFILALEGTLCFAGAAAKRIGVSKSGTPTFPFQFRITVTNSDNTGGGDNGGGELWLPLWRHPTHFAEIRQTIAEGRAEVGSRVAQRGVDMVRAVTGLGIDRGISAFWRYAIVKGRVGGANYNTAVSLGNVRVHTCESVDLLREIDPWMNQYRKACSNRAVPPRCVGALRRIDSAIFDFCRYGESTTLGNVLCALGEAERHLNITERWRSENNLNPLGRLSSAWIQAASDGSLEFQLALALSGIHDAEFKVGPLRANLEPVNMGRLKSGRARVTWADRDRKVVWNAAALSTNLAAVLERRVLDGERAGCSCLPIGSNYSAPLGSVAALLAGGVDEPKVVQFLWGLLLVDQNRRSPDLRFSAAPYTFPLTRAYALLKLLFLPRPLFIRYGFNGKRKIRFARKDESGLRILPEPRLLALLRADRTDEACAIGARRLRASGFAPMPINWVDFGGLSGVQLAAALLIPIAERSLGELVNQVTRSETVAQ
jgi:CRISPR-associated protein Csx17